VRADQCRVRFTRGAQDAEGDPAEHATLPAARTWHPQGASIELTAAVPAPGAPPTIAERIPTAGTVALVVPPVTAGTAILTEATRAAIEHARTAEPEPLLVDLTLTASGLAVTGCRPGTHPSGLLGPTRPWLTAHRAGTTATGHTLGEALARTHLHRGDPPPTSGVIHVAVDGAALRSALLPLRELLDLGFTLTATPNMRALLHRHAIPAATGGNADVVVDRSTVAELPALVLTIQALASMPADPAQSLTAGTRG
jgi:hypothetical protein